MLLISPLIILSSIVTYVAVRLRAKKSTGTIASASIVVLGLILVEIEFFSFINNFLSWKSISLATVGLIVLEIHLRIKEKLTLKRNLIDFGYVKSLGPDFVREHDAYYASLKSGVDFNAYCLENEIESRQINIENEFRFTADQPSEPCSKIFILGGSTVFNAQVPNSHTIASLLQSELRENGRNYSVINFGKSGATSINRIEFIKNQKTLCRGDTVILYFGINDACINKKDFKFKSNPIHLVLVALNMVKNLLGKYLLTFEKLPRFSKFGTKYAVKKYINEEVVVAIRSFSNNCETLGVKFVAVLQPSAYSCRGINRIESRYLNQFANSPKRALQVANRVIIEELCDDHYFVNGLMVFDDAEDAVFTDWCHTTKYGNLLLSKFFFDELMRLNYLRG